MYTQTWAHRKWTSQMEIGLFNTNGSLFFLVVIAVVLVVVVVVIVSSAQYSTIGVRLSIHHTVCIKVYTLIMRRWLFYCFPFLSSTFIVLGNIVVDKCGRECIFICARFTSFCCWCFFSRRPGYFACFSFCWLLLSQMSVIL